MIEPSLVLPSQDTNRLKQAQRAEGIGIGGIFRGFEGYLDVRLRREIVDFVWLRFLHDADNVGRIGQVAIMQIKGNSRLVRIAINAV